MLRVRSERDWDAVDAYRQQQARAYFALLEAGELLKHRVEQQLRRDGGLSYVQFRILAALMEAGGTARMTDLADRLVFSQGGLTYQAGLLEKAGLITRRRAEDDERSTRVTLSGKGQQLMDTVLPGHLALVERELFGQLTPEDVSTLDEVLTRVTDHLRAFPPRSSASRSKPPPSQGNHKDSN